MDWCVCVVVPSPVRHVRVRLELLRREPGSSPWRTSLLLASPSPPHPPPISSSRRYAFSDASPPPPLLLLLLLFLSGVVPVGCRAGSRLKAWAPASGFTAELDGWRGLRVPAEHSLPTPRTHSRSSAVQKRRKGRRKSPPHYCHLEPRHED